MLKRNNTKRSLREYYVEYYNKHLLRNYRFLFDKRQSFVNKEGETITYEATSLNAAKYVEDDNPLKRAPNWIVEKTRKKYGTLAGEITYFKTMQEFKDDNIANRYCDRLFFDFDIDDNPAVKELKAQFKLAHRKLDGKEHRQVIEILQDDFKRLIFEEDLLQDVFDEATRLCAYLQRFNVKPYLVFSGSKGFHVNVMFNETRLTNLSEISKTLARSYSKELNLTALDFNVFDRERAHKRLQRIQYGLHSKTGLITRPLDVNTTYDELLETIKSKSRRPIEFNFDEYTAPAGFNKMLLKLDREIAFKKAERQKRLERENREKRLALQKKYGENFKSFNDIDLRDIARAYGIDGRRESNKTIVNCPFHHDVHPSAVVYPQRFYCSTCAMSLNYYEFISRLEGTNDKDKILDIARGFL